MRAHETALKCCALNDCRRGCRNAACTYVPGCWVPPLGARS